MFSRLKNPLSSEAASTQQFAQPKKSTRAAPSILSADLQIEGQLDSNGDIQLDGRIEGNIRSASLTIGKKAHINGDIIANEVTIHGRISGNIRARKVQLICSAHVEGAVFHNTLTVEPGAYLNGNCQHVEDPLTADKSKSPSHSKDDGQSNAQLATALNTDEVTHLEPLDRDGTPQVVLPGPLSGVSRLRRS